MMNSLIKPALRKLAAPGSPLRPLRMLALKAQYRGNRYECPMCGAKLKSFVSHGLKVPAAAEKEVVGAGWRENVLCPHCWVSDRDRLLHKYVTANDALIPEGATVLHVAPESVLAKIFRARSDVTYLTCDYSRSTSVNLDIQFLPFPNDSIDLIVCNHVLEHVDDDRLALSELLRVLRPSGYAMLQVPIALGEKNTFEDPAIKDPRERELAFIQDDHVRLYGRDYADRVRAAGFNLEEVKWQNRSDLFGVDAERYGFNPREVIHLAQKPEVNDF